MLSMMQRELLVQHSKVSGESLEMLLSGIEPALSTNSQQERDSLPLLSRSLFAKKTVSAQCQHVFMPLAHADFSRYQGTGLGRRAGGTFPDFYSPVLMVYF